MDLACPQFLIGALKTGLQAESELTQMPRPSTLAAHRLSLDMAIIALSRAHSVKQAYVRYGWSDSSPVAGFDWLWSQEHRVAVEQILPVFRAFHGFRKYPLYPTPCKGIIFQVL
eukprot:6492561-Amphidinium_carterae.1